MSEETATEVPRKQRKKRVKPSADTCWGIETAIDLHNCDPKKIRDADLIKQFVKELLEKIEMKAFGECQVVHFGEDERVAGFSMCQLIETSLISAHFANATNNVYLNVFSCKPYDIKIVKRFTRKFFKGKIVRTKINYRT